MLDVIHVKITLDFPKKHISYFIFWSLSFR